MTLPVQSAASAQSVGPGDRLSPEGSGPRSEVASPGGPRRPATPPGTPAAAPVASLLAARQLSPACEDHFTHLCTVSASHWEGSSMRTGPGHVSVLSPAHLRALISTCGVSE